jgi:predicted O-methyltransferase YrrM
MTEPLEATRHYLQALFGAEEGILPTIRQHLKRHKLPDISVPPEVGRLLSFLVRLCQPQHILEVGTLGGVSGICLLQGDADLVTIEKGELQAAVAEESFALAGLADRVEVLVGDARTVLPTLTPPFDLLFLDAEKSEYPDYLELAIPLIRPGGLIVADNVLRRGKPVYPTPGDATATGLRRFNRQLADDPRLDAVILPLLGDYSFNSIDGIAIARVNLSVA